MAVWAWNGRRGWASVVKEGGSDTDAPTTEYPQLSTKKPKYGGMREVNRGVVSGGWGWGGVPIPGEP
eukprot:415839-Hanusia_phi.AAC.1